MDLEPALSMLAPPISKEESFASRVMNSENSEVLMIPYCLRAEKRRGPELCEGEMNSLPRPSIPCLLF